MLPLRDRRTAIHSPRQTPLLRLRRNPFDGPNYARRAISLFGPILFVVYLSSALAFKSADFRFMKSGSTGSEAGSKHRTSRFVRAST